MSFTAALTAIEAGATHIITLVEQDAETAVTRIRAAYHVLGGDIKGTVSKIEADALLEINAIKAKAEADAKAVTDKVAAIKAALGL